MYSCWWWRNPLLFFCLCRRFFLILRLRRFLEKLFGSSSFGWCATIFLHFFSMSDSSAKYPPDRLRGGASFTVNSFNNSTNSDSWSSTEKSTADNIPTVISVSSDWESNPTLPIYKTSVQDIIPLTLTTNHDDIDSDCSSIEFDATDASPIGGKMESIKIDNMIRLSGCNPNGITSQNIRSQLQHSMDLDIDIQCYSEVNANLLKSNLRHKFHETVSSMDRNSKATWSTSDVPCDINFKLVGTCIINRSILNVLKSMKRVENFI